MELLVRCSRDVGTIDADVYNSAGKAGAKSGSEIQVRVIAREKFERQGDDEGEGEGDGDS